MLNQQTQKKWVKTGLAALLFSCLSVGAFAEMQWVRVSGVYIGDDELNSAAEVCQRIMREDTSYYQWGARWDGTWYWSGDKGDTSRDMYGMEYLMCGVTGTDNWEALWNHLYCKKSGQERRHRDFGCYELQEVEEPDPCLTRSGEQCEKPEQDHCPGLRQGVMSGEIGIEDLLKECPEFPPNDPLCNNRSMGHMGGVACISDNISYKPVCIWDIPYADPIARQIVYFCTIRHETAHRNFPGMRCNAEFGRMGASEEDGTFYMTEIESTNITLSCLAEYKGSCRWSANPSSCEVEIQDFEDFERSWLKANEDDLNKLANM